MTKVLLTATAAIWVAFSCTAIWAQDFPVRPLRLATIFAPGSASDVHARFIAQKLTEQLGQTVVVDNRPGAGGLVATRDVIRSQPMGYSMLYTTPEVVGNVFAYKDPQYKLDDLALVGPFAIGCYAMIIHTSVPAKTVAEFVTYAKANPGKLNYGSLGASSGSTINAERFKQAAGIDMVMIPFKGGDPVATALLAGDVQVYFATLYTARIRMRNAQIRGLALASEHLIKSVPELPTFKELGYPTVSLVYWSAVFAPAAAPRPILQRLQDAMGKFTAMPETKAVLAKQDIETWSGTLDQFSAFIRAEGASLAADYKRLNIPLLD